MQYIDANHPIYALQARRLSEPGYLPLTVVEIATDYIDQIRKIQPAGPYNLIGWSFGGHVAHTIASLLRQQGEPVALLAVLDAYPPVTQQPAVRETRDQILSSIFQFLGYDMEDESLDTSNLIELYNEIGEYYPLDAIIEEIQNTDSVLETFTPQHYDGNLLLFTASDSRMKPEAWRPYISGEITVNPIPCRHNDMLIHREPASQIGHVILAELKKLYQRNE